VLSSEAQDAAKCLSTRRSCGRRRSLLPPDVNESYSGFTPLSGAIRYGLTAIKGWASRLLKRFVKRARPVRSDLSLILPNESSRPP
jgi:DNA polymerase III alpha subunit